MIQEAPASLGGEQFTEYLAPYRDVVAKNLVPNLPKPAQIFQGVGLFEMNSAVNDKLFETYLALALKQSSLAFCNNLDRIQLIEDGIYQAVTTTASIINRLGEKQRQIEEVEAQKKSARTTVGKLPRRYVHNLRR